MIVAKAIDQSTITANTNLSDGTPFIAFGFDVYDNLNTDNGEYDSWNRVQGLCTYNQFSMSESINSADEVNELVSVTLGNRTFNFANGEYQNLDGTPFNVGIISGAIISALNL